MSMRTENCMICGNDLVYFETAREQRCFICGAKGNANASCKCGHYVCDACHAEKGLLFIARHTSESRSRNPVAIAMEMMENSSINMHGPEHHYLVAAALLAAYKNAGGRIDLDSALLFALQRAKNVPGGICGLWGCCGAGVASGIFVSVVTGATPLSESEWSLANQMTSRSLLLIAQHGGPRCCKRNSFLAIHQAAAFAKEQLGVAMELPQQVACAFSHRNKQCKKNKCLYYTAE